MSLNDLQEFVIRLGLHNSSFQQAVFQEFTPQQKRHGNIDYSEIIRCALEDIDFDMDDIYDYHYDCFEIVVLDHWLNKARAYIEQDNWEETILIAKACLEEYAEWADNSLKWPQDTFGKESIVCCANTAIQPICKCWLPKQY